MSVHVLMAMPMTLAMTLRHSSGVARTAKPQGAARTRCNAVVHENGINSGRAAGSIRGGPGARWPSKSPTAELQGAPHTA